MNDDNMITVEQMVYVFNHNGEDYEFRSEDEFALCWVTNNGQNGWKLYIEGAAFCDSLEFDLTDAEINFENGRFTIRLATGRYVRILVLQRAEKVDFPSPEWAAKQIAND